MIYHLLSRLNRETIDAYLLGTGIVAPYPSRILEIEDVPGRTVFDPGTYIVATCDQLTTEGRSYAARLADRLASCSGIRLLNHPDRTLTRFDLLRELHRQGINRQRVARPDEDLRALRYPLIVRSAASHGGPLSRPLSSRWDLAAFVGLGLAMGYGLDDLMVTEFLDTADRNGRYRKYAAYIVGPTIVARSLTISRRWMVKYRGQDPTVPNAQEEFEYVRDNPHERELERIAKIAGIEYGRIDYGVIDGRVNVWEINLNPTIGRPLRQKRPLAAPPDVKALMDQSRALFHERFRAALGAIDSIKSTEPVILADPPAAPDRMVWRLPRRRRKVYDVGLRVRGWGKLGTLAATPWLRMLEWLGRPIGFLVRPRAVAPSSS